MQNIDIRFNGHSNFKRVQADLVALKGQFADLNAQTQQLARGAGGQAYQKQINRMNELRRSTNMQITSQGAFIAETTRLTAATTELNDRIARQKVHYGELFRDMGRFKDAMREQIALRNMMVATYQRSASGKVSADIFVPTSEMVRGMETTRQKVGFLAQALSSANTQLVNWGKNTQWAGRQLMVGFTVPSAMAAAGMAKIAFEADKGMTRIVKVYDNGADGVTRSTEQIRTAAMKTARDMAVAYGANIKDTLEIQAELAAAGRTGTDLAQQTEQVTRAMVLGELDLQKSLETTITLQSAYKMSTQELAETWNFFNSIENGTVLQMKDITESLPRVAGVMNALGASVQDTTVLMAAFKAAGIDAAEGANALKSITFKGISPVASAQKNFESITGIDYDELIKRTNGEVIPTLMELGEEIRALQDAGQRADAVRAVKELFGIYQGSKAFGLLQSMADLGDEATQVGRAFAIAQQDAKEWAKTANSEVKTLRESISNRFMRALNTLKAEFAETGMVVLRMITPLVEGLVRFMAAVNDLDEGQKKFLMWGIIAAGLAGPVIMLAGLFMNLVGMTGKLAVGLLKLIAPFEILNAKQMAARLEAKMAALALDGQAAAVTNLTRAIQELNAMTAIGKMGQMSEFREWTIGPGAKEMYRYDEKGKRVDASPAQRLKAQQELATLQQSTTQQTAVMERNWAKTARHMTGAASTLSMIGMMASPGGTIGNIMSGAFLATTVATLMPDKFWNKIGDVGSNAMNRITQSTKNASSAFKPLKENATRFSNFATSAWGIGIASAIAIATIALDRHKQKMEEQKKMYEAVADSAKGWAEIVGFSYQEATAVAAKTDPAKTIKSEAAAFVKANKDAAAYLQKQIGKDYQEKVLIAINEAIKAKVHGATPEQAAKTARVAMEVMGETIQNYPAFEKEVFLTLSTAPGMEERMRTEMQRVLDRAAKGAYESEDSFMESILRASDNKGLISSQGMNEMHKAVTEWYDTFVQMNNDQQSIALKQIREQSGGKALEDYYKELMTKYPERLKGQTLSQFVQTTAEGELGSTAGMRSYQMMTRADKERMKQMQYSAQAYRALIQEMLTAAGVQDSVKDGVYDFAGAMEVMGVHIRNATEIENDQMKKEKDLYRQKILLGNATANTGAKAQTAASQWEAFAKSIEDTGFSVDSMIGAFRGAMSKSMDVAFEAADSMYADRQRNEMEALQANAEAAMERLENAGDAARKRQERKEEALDRRLDKMQEQQEAKQERRRKTVEKYYDTRIAKIDAALKKEQEAEEARQKIYERERTRLQRLAGVFSQNIDFNTAVSTGNLDEAAKIANDMQATQAQQAVEDSAEGSTTNSQRRIESLEQQRKRLEDQKTARLESLRITEEAEKKWFEAYKRRQSEALDAEKDRLEKSLDAERNALQKKQEANERSLQRRQEMEKRALDQQLLALRAFIPKDEKERAKHISRIEKAYGLHGGVLMDRGTYWGKIVGNALEDNVREAAVALRTEINWKQIGLDSANKMIKGALNMTVSQFQEYLKSGSMPKNYAPMTGESRHTGGVIGSGSGSRAGFSGGQSQSETWINALKGEGVLNRKAMGTPGVVDFMELANEGRIPKNIGGPDMMTGLSGIMGSVLGGVMKGALGNVVKGSANTFGSAFAAGKPGRYGGTTFDASQLANAGIIADVGRGLGASGRDIIIALMTAMQESMLRNIPFGDRDSVGLFQQRNAWGSFEQRMNPRTSAKMFFTGGMQGQRGLFDFQNRGSMTLAQAAQAVQVSAFPDAYAKWEDEARAIMSGGFAAQGGAGSWRMPANGPITSRYGYRIHPITGERRLHAGTDIGAPGGAPIYASGGGKVTAAGWNGGYGNYTIVDHGNGQKTAYAHQRSMNVRAGQFVSPGQVIGRVGTTGASTGNHLHFEYIKNGLRVNPNLLIPGLLTGADILRGGLANLHPEETVLPRPLSRSLKDGIENMEDGGGIHIDNLTFEFTGAVNTKIDFKNAVKEVFREIVREEAPKRKIGGKK